MKLPEWWHNCYCCKYHLVWALVLFFFLVFDEDPEVDSVKVEEKPTPTYQTCQQTLQPSQNQGQYRYFPYYKPRYRTDEDKPNSGFRPQYSPSQSYGRYAPNSSPYGTFSPNNSMPNNPWQPTPIYPSPKYPVNNK